MRDYQLHGYIKKFAQKRKCGDLGNQGIARDKGGSKIIACESTWAQPCIPQSSLEWRQPCLIWHAVAHSLRNGQLLYTLVWPLWHLTLVEENVYICNTKCLISAKFCLCLSLY